MITNTKNRGTALLLARELGYRHAVLINGGLIVDGTDYIRDILAPRGLVSWDHKCNDWAEACRLLGLLPPARP